ncbi:MAG: hypothetical protein AAB632_00605 [Patescibacteria group bacterium]
MKKSLLIAMLILSLLLLFTGCKKEYPSRQGQLQDTGIFGEHPVDQIEHTAGLNGNMVGLFFLGTGAVNGQVTAGERIRFWWLRNQDTLVPTEMPYGMLEVRRDETKAIPTVEFIFNEGWLKNGNESWNQYSESEKMNMNSFLDDEMVDKKHLVLVIVRISGKDLENEIFLPKPDSRP